MELKQQLRLSQQLVMTPQLQQAIKLLQMSRMELVDLVREEMLENPVLEDGIDGGDRPEAQADAAANGENQPQAEAQADAEPKEEKKADDIDWERYLENHAMQAPVPSYRGGGADDELPGIEATLSKSED